MTIAYTRMYSTTPRPPPRRPLAFPVVISFYALFSLCSFCVCVCCLLFNRKLVCLSARQAGQSVRKPCRAPTHTSTHTHRERERQTVSRYFTCTRIRIRTRSHIQLYCPIAFRIQFQYQIQIQIHFQCLRFRIPFSK